MISVVVPVFNKSELTRRCLDSVLKNSRKLSEVRVVDNASTDDTSSLLIEFEAQFRAAGIDFKVIRNAQNLGFGRACNQGIRLAQGAWIAILNNDTWVMPDWDAELIREADKRNLDCIGPHFDERPWINTIAERAQEFRERNRDRFRKHFVPILMVFRRSAIDRLSFPDGGIFDERFFVTYEDTDLRYRMDDLQMRYGQTSNAFIWHHSRGTRSTPGLLQDGYEQEGLRLFVEKWGFDPRKSENTWIERWKRKRRKSRSARGLF
jgi:GT2 family glycosyltransferase